MKKQIDVGYLNGDYSLHLSDITVPTMVLPVTRYYLR